MDIFPTPRSQNDTNIIHFVKHVNILPACMCKITLRGSTQRCGDRLALRWHESALMDFSVLGIGTKTCFSRYWLKQPKGQKRKIQFEYVSANTLQLEYDNEVFIFTRSIDKELDNLMPIEQFILLQILAEVYKNIEAFVHHTK
jgi:hypothetical protein